MIHQYDRELSAFGHEEMIAAAGVVAHPGNRSLCRYGQPVDRSAFRRAPARDRKVGTVPGGGRCATVEGAGGRGRH